MRILISLSCWLGIRAIWNIWERYLLRKPSLLLVSLRGEGKKELFGCFSWVGFPVGDEIFLLIFFLLLFSLLQLRMDYPSSRLPHSMLPMLNLLSRISYQVCRGRNHILTNTYPSWPPPPPQYRNLQHRFQQGTRIIRRCHQTKGRWNYHGITYTRRRWLEAG